MRLVVPEIQRVTGVGVESSFIEDAVAVLDPLAQHLAACNWIEFNLIIIAFISGISAIVLDLIRWTWTLDTNPSADWINQSGLTVNRLLWPLIINWPIRSGFKKFWRIVKSSSFGIFYGIVMEFLWNFVGGVWRLQLTGNEAILTITPIDGTAPIDSQFSYVILS